MPPLIVSVLVAFTIASYNYGWFLLNHPALKFDVRSIELKSFTMLPKVQCGKL